MIIPEFYSNMHGFDYSIPHFITFVRGTRIVVTPELIFDVLHVSQESHPDYLKCPHLKIVSKDKLLSLFCETPSSWVNLQNTSCLGFAKGPRFQNMVMIFVLHLLSHYNFITEPHAYFLLSLIEDLTVDFSFHFILSLIYVYKDTMTSDKLIFPSAIMRIIRHFFVFYPESPHLTIMGAISAVSVKEWGLVSTKAAIDWECDSSIPFHSIHLRSFFFYGWCDAWGNHSVASAYGCSPWHFHWWDESSDHPCGSYCMMSSSPWWLNCLHLHRLQTKRTMMIMMMRMRKRMLALLVMRRWLVLNDLPFVICDKKGE